MNDKPETDLLDPQKLVIRKIAARAVDKIVANLTDRSGCGWDGIDDDVQHEIIDEWQQIVYEEIVRSL